MTDMAFKNAFKEIFNFLNLVKECQKYILEQIRAEIAPLFTYQIMGITNLRQGFGTSVLCLIVNEPLDII